MLRAAILALVALPVTAVPPVLAQEERSRSDVWLGFSTGYINLGPFVREETHHVRFGNTGKDIYFAFDLEASIPDRPLGIYARLMVAPMHYFRWRIDPDSPEISRWTSRPSGQTQVSSVVWSCVGVGARYSPVPWVALGIGPGLCTLSGGTYIFGALPIHTPVINAGVRVTPKITDRLRMGVECGSDPAHIHRNSFVVLHEQAGDSPRTGRWIKPVQCGVVMKVRT